MKVLVAGGEGFVGRALPAESRARLHVDDDAATVHWYLANPPALCDVNSDQDASRRPGASARRASE